MEQFMKETMQPLFSALAMAVITALVAAITNYIHKKTGIQISEATERKAEAAAMNAVLAIEEKAASKAIAWTGEQKYSTAINTVLSMVPSLTAEQAGVLVNAALAKVPGLGASGDVYATPKIEAPAGGSNAKV